MYWLSVVNVIYIIKTNQMATNGKSGDNRRHGAVRKRSQTQTGSGNWVKRNTETGMFMDVKQDDQPFKGVTKEKKK